MEMEGLFSALNAVNTFHDHSHPDSFFFFPSIDTLLGKISFAKNLMCLLLYFQFCNVLTFMLF